MQIARMPTETNGRCGCDAVIAELAEIKERSSRFQKLGGKTERMVGPLHR